MSSGREGDMAKRLVGSSYIDCILALRAYEPCLSLVQAKDVLRYIEQLVAEQHKLDE